MIRLYKYIFYRFYHWNRIGDMWGYEAAVTQAVSQTGMLLVLQFLTAAFLVDDIAGHHFVEHIGGAGALLGDCIAAVLVIGLIAYFGGEAGYKRIIEEFDAKKETKSQKRIRGIAIWAYIAIFSLGLFVVI